MGRMKLAAAFVLIIVVLAAPRPGPHDDVPASAGDRTGASQPQASDPPADQRPSSGVEGSDAPFDPSSFPPIGHGVLNPSGGLDAGEFCSDPPDCGYIAPTPTAETVYAGGISGQATWWNSFGDGYYAAIRPDLGSKGDLAVVCGGWPFHCRTVNIITTCACLGPNSNRLIDLSLDTFVDFAPPGVDEDGKPRAPGWQGAIRITLQVLER